MFGCLVSGRLVQTNVVQVDETKFLFNLENPDAINHVVIFMTGTIPFPDGMGGAVYFSFTSANQQPAWMYLGYISNEKPSAIFKISNLKKDIPSEQPTLLFSSLNQASTARPTVHVAQIGISVEQIAQIYQQTPVSQSNTNTVSSFPQKMLENFYNFASSFAISQAQMTPQPNETFIPFNVLQKWFDNIQKKMANQPNFWKS